MSTETDDSYVYDLDKYEFLVIIGGFVCFAMAWGIGANDVANGTIACFLFITLFSPIMTNNQ